MRLFYILLLSFNFYNVLGTILAPLTNDDRDYYDPGSCTENERMVSGECADCPQGLSNPFEFTADDTVFYAGKPCANTTDCEQKCMADKSCEGYSHHYGKDNNYLYNARIGWIDYNNLNINGVVDMVGNSYAFIVLVDDGSVKAFGTASDGGSGPDVEITSGAKSIHSSDNAFAVLMNNGTIIAWGDANHGGNTTGVDLSSGFVSITSNYYGFAGLKSDGSAVAWGDSRYGGDATGVDLSSGVLKIYSQKHAFAALKSDGSVQAWGDASYGGTDPGIGAGSGVVKIFPNKDDTSSWKASNERAFAALLSNRTVIAWGASGYGGNAPSGLTDVVNIYSTRYAFAALKTDGSVKAWGASSHGGTDPGLTGNVSTIFSNHFAFAALKSDGSVQVWGDSSYGGTDPGITSGVVKIFSTGYAFAALKTDGSVKVWGDSGYGGKDPGIGSGFSNIYATLGAFAGLKTDGSLYRWGSESYGGVGSSQNNVKHINVGAGISHVFTFKYGFAFVSFQGLRYGSKSSGFGKSFKLKGDDPSALNSLGYLIDDSVKYGSTACDNSTDCGQKCSVDASCQGYTRSGGVLHAWGSFANGGYGPLLSGVTKVYGGYNSRSFHAIMYDGNIKSWGDTIFGGGGADPNARNVKDIVSTYYHVMALLEDGTTRSWGNHDTKDIDLLTGVTKIVASNGAFAALKSDGTVVTDGGIYSGGCNSGSGIYNFYSCKPDDLADVVDMFANQGSFAALRSNGSLVVWGDADQGGSATGVDLSSGVVEVVATDWAWAARKSDGTVVAWGYPTEGGDASGVNLTGVTNIYSTNYAFAALKSDGSVVAWGKSDDGGTAPSITSGVIKIYAAKYAFAALKSDGSIVSWGSYVGTSPTGDFTGVDIITNNGGFAALKSDGTVVTWGSTSLTAAPSGLSGVTKIVASQGAFTALKSDGTVVTWGSNSAGGCDSGSGTTSYNCKPSDLTGVTDIYATRQAFAAITSIQSEYGPLIAGSGDSLVKNADTTCDTSSSSGCAQNERVVSNACAACPVGTTNAAGDDPTGSDTTCDPILCGANLRVVNNDCVSCPAGTTNDAGDDSSGADTNCDPILCGANLRVVNNDCVSCPPGTSNDAGDDASGADTTCDPISCGANEHVVSNVCTPCPDTSTKPAGDDASGADTVCVCPANEFLNATSQCDTCATGTGGDGSACDKCAENYHVSSNQCVACPDGTRQAGDDPTGADTVCVCPTDKIMNATNQCEACPTGRSGDGSVCDKCAENYRLGSEYSSVVNKLYGVSGCTGASDCQSKCSVDNSCEGYSSSTNKFMMASGQKTNCIILDQGLKCWGGAIMGDTVIYGDGPGEMGTDLPFIDMGTDTISKMGIGSVHMCVLLSNGKVKCWGNNSYKQLGLVSGQLTSPPADPLNLGADATDICVGMYHSCAVLSDGGVKCWGWNRYGELGMPKTTSYSIVPENSINMGGSATQISCGDSYTCAILSTGDVKCWGLGGAQLGQGDSNDRDSPVPVDFGTGRTAVQIVAGRRHVCVLMDNSQVKCWGAGSYLGRDHQYTYDQGDQPGEMGDNLAVTDLGTVGTVVSLSDGPEFRSVCALFDNGKLKCWGANTYGLGFVSSDSVVGNGQGEMGDNLPFVDLGTGRTAVAVTGGSQFHCAVLDDASVKCFGWNAYGQLGYGDLVNRGKAADSVGDNLATVSLGGSAMLLKLSYGTLQSGTADGYTKSAACVACPTGTVNVAGDDANGNISYCDRVVPCGQNEFFNTNHQCEACASGTYNDVGDTVVGSCDDTEKCLENAHVETTYNSDNTKMYGLTACSDTLDCQTKCTMDSACAGISEKVGKIAMGWYHTCALFTNSSVYCLGRNAEGQLGDGTVGSDVYTWVYTGINNAIDIACNGGTSAAVLADNTVRFWGQEQRHWGDGSFTGSSTPVISRQTITDAVKISMGTTTTCILTTSNGLTCMGSYSGTGPNFQPTSIFSSGIIDFSFGNTHGCVVKEDNTARCWGDNPGRLGDGTTYSRTTPTLVSGGISFSRIYASHSHTCGIATNSKVYCWGLKSGYRVEPGVSDSTEQLTPLDLGLNAKDMALGNTATCFIKLNDELHCWGVAENGFQTTPALITTSILQVAVSQFYYGSSMVAIGSNGNLYSLGYNPQGQLAIGANGHQQTVVETASDMMFVYKAYGPLVSGTATSFTKDKGCKLCPAGYINDAMDDPSGLDTPCDFIPCQINERITNGQCTPCTVGATRAAGDSDPLVDTYCTCGINQHVVSGVCTECPSGSTRATGDDASGADTVCLIAPCAKDYRVKDNVCVLCPTGMTNDAGDTNANGDTYCDSTFVCGEDQYVSNHQCVNCPAAKTTPYGSNPAGADTECNWIVCGRDEYSNGASCQPCATGSYNNPGDTIETVTTCNDAQICKENHQLSFKYTLQANYQISNGAGYLAENAITDFDYAKKLCDLDSSCNGLTKDASNNYYLSDGTASSNSAYDAYNINRAAFDCLACRGSGTHAAGEDPNTATGITNCAYADCPANYGSSGGSCVACTGGKIRNPPINPEQDHKCTIVPCAENERVEPYVDFETSTNFYGGNVCTSEADCEAKCSADASCEGYSILESGEFLSNTQVSYTGTSCNGAGDCTTKCVGDSNCQGFSRSVANGLSYAGDNDVPTDTTYEDCQLYFYYGGGGAIPINLGWAPRGCITYRSCSSCNWEKRWNNYGCTNCASVNSFGKEANAIKSNAVWTYGNQVSLTSSQAYTYNFGTSYSYGTETTASGISPSWTSKTAVTVGRCTACVAPSTNEAGDTDLNGETFCDWGNCGLNQYASNKQCVACAAGTFNDAGDPAAFDSTCDDPDTCDQNEYSDGTQCLPCPGSGTRPAGDRANVVTSCTFPTCGANERVVSNACVACGAGTFNDAGDDAGGADTTCDDSEVCPANHYALANYVSSTNNYGTTSCSSDSDCETKCAMSASCDGYTNNGFGILGAWGDSGNGGSNPGITSGVVDIVSNTFRSGELQSNVYSAFAALKTDGSVQVWGHSSWGGTDPGLTSGVVKIFSNDYAFAALKDDGSVKAWGYSNKGGTDPSITSGVTDIVSTDYAFAALKSDGSVKAWGDTANGGSDPGITSGVTKIFSNSKAFAALKGDGSVQVWGDTANGGTDPSITSGVTKIFSAVYAFAALKTDGSVKAWGGSYDGGTDPGITGGVVKIVSTYYAFAALKTDGSVQVWGNSYYGGSNPGLTGNVSTIFSTSGAFAALKTDGSVVAWGNSDYGGSNPGITSGVVKIFSNTYAFAALKTDGSVKVWGGSADGGSDPGLTGNVSTIFSTARAFAALKTDGSVVAWGDPAKGGSNPGLTSGVTKIFSARNVFVAVGQPDLEYGPLVAGSGSSHEKSGTCTPCTNSGTNAGGKIDSGLVCVYPDCQTDQYSTGNGQCLTCPVGRFVPTPINPSTAAQCTCLANERVQSNACVACPSGFTNAAGDDPNGADTECDFTPCALNHYVAGTGDSRVCTACTGGTFSAGGLVTECSGTEYCAVNQKVVSNSCVNCPAGQQNALGVATDKSGADGTCAAAPCVANQYSDGSICHDCPQHTGANSAGLDPTAGVTQCVPTTCGTDQHVESNVCKLCDSTSYRLAGDQVFGGDTHCFCKDHHKVINKACVACEVGSSNPNLCYSGLQNHYCVCDANYHVVSNLCTACPGSATRPAGDYAGNADTHCICGEDQHVVSNACVACPAGTKRPAGDDSSGVDTPCSCQENEHVLVISAEQVASGSAHTCILLSGGKVECFGDNAKSQIGTVAGGEKLTPTEISGISNAVEIAAGGEHTCARLADGTIKCWGDNSFGQCGNGQKLAVGGVFNPVEVSGITDAVAITAGSYFTCANLGNWQS